MLKYLILIVIYSLPILVSGQGTLTDTTFFSPILAKDRNMQVYLPKGYNTEDSTKYPVIYYLHGAFVNHTDLGSEISAILDTLIDDKTISPMIVVKPDGSVGPWAGSFYTNSELYGNFEDYIVYDLVSYIDTTFNTIADRRGRAIWGGSMGAYGSMKLALKHPDIYCGVAAHSGPLDFSHFSDAVDTILSENGGAPVSIYIPTPMYLFTYFFYTMAGAFSPNLSNTPYPVDFPLDSLGNFIDSTYNRWLLHDPVRLASNFNPDYDLGIYFDCGQKDELLLYPFNVAFSDSLDQYGLKHVFKSHHGGHTDSLTYILPIALSFLDSVMKIPETGINNEDRYPISACHLSQNYPNPFNPKTVIRYSVGANGHSPLQYVDLSIYNILGQKVATLVNKKQMEGNYQIEWDASNFASGVYLYRLSADQDYSQTKKLVLLK
jgi:enterochelin esterase-like enzyme